MTVLAFNMDKGSQPQKHSGCQQINCLARDEYLCARLGGHWECLSLPHSVSLPEKEKTVCWTVLSIRKKMEMELL